MSRLAPITASLLFVAACAGSTTEPPPRPSGPIEVTSAYAVSGSSVQCYWADYEVEHPSSYSVRQSDGSILESPSTVHA